MCIIFWVLICRAIGVVILVREVVRPDGSGRFTEHPGCPPLKDLGPIGAVWTPEVDDFRSVLWGDRSGPNTLHLLWRPIDGRTYRRANPAKPCNLQGFAGLARR